MVAKSCLLDLASQHRHGSDQLLQDRRVMPFSDLRRGIAFQQASRR